MFVESVLTERLGDVGKKLHTARSRNDQVALDIRLYLRGEVKEILARTDGLLDALLGQAKAHADTIMPGLHAPASGRSRSPSGITCWPTA